MSQAEADRRFQEKHPERRRLQKREAMRRYRKRHPGRVEASAARYEASNPGRALRYYYENKESCIRTAKAHALIRKARKRRQATEYVDALVVLEEHDGVCGICGEDVDPFDFHVDHRAPLSRGGEHAYLNCQPAHPFCNLSKHNRGGSG